METMEQYAWSEYDWRTEYDKEQEYGTEQADDLLSLEAEPQPQPLFAILYFQNGKRLQVIGEKGEIATFNLSTAEHYSDLFCFLFATLCYEHGTIRIRDEHYAHLPPCFHPYFEPIKPTAEEREKEARAKFNSVRREQSGG
jgi:hypothetical protein